MSLMKYVPEVGEGDKLQVDYGERVFDVTVTAVATDAKRYLTVHCVIDGEVPDWALKIDRELKPPRPRHRWWPWS